MADKYGLKKMVEEAAKKDPVKTDYQERYKEVLEENKLLKAQLEEVNTHMKKINPDTLVRYLGKKPNFIFRGKYDFSAAGVCIMPKDEAMALVELDPRCFSIGR